MNTRDTSALHAYCKPPEPVQRIDRASAEAAVYPVFDLAQYQAQVEIEQQIVEAGLPWLLWATRTALAPTSVALTVSPTWPACAADDLLSCGAPARLPEWSPSLRQASHFQSRASGAAAAGAASAPVGPRRRRSHSADGQLDSACSDKYGIHRPFDRYRNDKGG